MSDAIPTPDDILSQTRLKNGWHRISQDNKSMLLAEQDLRLRLEAAYCPNSADWLSRIWLADENMT